QPATYPSSKYFLEIKSEKSGFVADIHSREIGILSMELGAGRNKMSDSVDYTSGIVLHKKVGDEVRTGETLAVGYSNKKELLHKNELRVQRAFKIVDKKVSPAPLIYSFIDSTGEKIWKPD
ncbi:MAG: hypothetical protein ACE5HX_13445, partial [bacterium]